MSEFELHEEDYRKKLDLGLWRRAIARARPYRRPLLGMAGCGMAMAAADALLPRVTGFVVDAATQHGVGQALRRPCLEFFGLVVIMGLLVWGFIVLAGKIATGYAYDTRRAAFARLQELSFSYYDRRPMGWIMARLTSDCDRLSSLLPWFLLDLSWGVSLLAGICVIMLCLNAPLALFVMSVMPPLAVASALFQKRLLATQRAARRVNSQITASFNESIMGARTTKALVREEENLEEFSMLTRSMYGYSVRNALLAAGYLPIVLTLGSMGVGFSLWKGGLALTHVGGLSLGTLIAFMQYAAFFYIPIQELAARFTQVQAAQTSAERLQGLLDSEPEIRDSEVVRNRIALRRAAEDFTVPGRGIAVTGRRAGIALDGRENEIRDLEFERVSFAYGSGEPVLADFSLRVGAGERIALVGATGSGKSTIVSLLCRFYEPTSGRILINGTDYRERSLAWLQSNLGVVLQTPHLFRGTIRENIRYGRLTATDSEVEEVARLTLAEGLIRAREKGYETEVGEGGSGLSTGEKQLLALARAVLADPQIFILDEATSSVDTETEQLIQQAIERVLADRTSFIIAHRLSTVRSSDRILVIERGRIVEEGDHDGLMRRRGRYHDLYRSQFARESLDLGIAPGGGGWYPGYA